MSAAKGGRVPEQLYRWFWKTRLPERRGSLFRVLARGRLNSCLIEFMDDGWLCVTSRNALRKASPEPAWTPSYVNDVLRARREPGDAGAGGCDMTSQRRTAGRNG